MSEYIYGSIGDPLANALGEIYLPRAEVVRCRDCKFGVDGGKYCAEGCADSWDWRNVEPDGFCSRGERRTNDN